MPLPDSGGNMASVMNIGKWAAIPVRLGEYFWAAGLLATGVMFTPLPPVVKIFLLCGLVWSAAFERLLVMTRLQAVPGTAGVMLLIGLAISVPATGVAQTGVPDYTPLDWQGKLTF